MKDNKIIKKSCFFMVIYNFKINSEFKNNFNISFILNDFPNFFLLKEKK